jgi:nitronate monooxygenase
VHGNYLKPSIIRAGLDPEALPGSDKTQMSFATNDTGERTKPKAWKDIWGSGQGIGSVKSIVSVEEFVARLRKEYFEAADPAFDGWAANARAA